MTQDGGFAEGWKDVVYATRLSICFLADLKLGGRKFYSHGFILSNA